MIFSEIRSLHPHLTECRFEKYVLLYEGTIIKFAFEAAYLNTDKVGAHHLHNSCLAEIQKRFEPAKAKQNYSKPLTLF